MGRRKDSYRVITDRILEQLDAGVVPWRRPWTSPDGFTMPRNLVSGAAYRGINPFLLLCSPYGSPFWATYRQAKKLGGHVRRGEKGTPVTFWKVWKKETETDDGEPTTRRVFILRHYTVFNLEQCADDAGRMSERADRLQPDTPAPATEPERVDAAEKILAAMPNRPPVRHARQARAFYSPATDTVTLPTRAQFVSSAGYYSTLFHELGHATGHATRLDRWTDDDRRAIFGSEPYAREELVAEFSAAFLCGAAGIVDETVNTSAAYIDAWRKKIDADPQIVIHAASAGQKASDYILGESWTDESEERDAA